MSRQWVPGFDVVDAQEIQEFPENPPDVLFDALAIVPMIGMAPGVPQQGLPFDLDELLKLVQK
jgi:hypothetical protein